MASTNSFLIAKKIHRLLVLLIIILGLIMVITGTLLKFTIITREYLTSIDLVQVRSLHRATSTYFSITFGLMMMTGAWMYGYTIYKKMTATKQKPPNNQRPPQS